jgi:hypothetical protein
MKYANHWQKLSELDGGGENRVPGGVWISNKNEFEKFLLERGDLSVSERFDLNLLKSWIDELIESMAEFRPRHFYLGGELAAHFYGFYPGEVLVECEESFAVRVAEFRRKAEFQHRISTLGKVVTRPKMPVSLDRIVNNFDRINQTGFLQATTYSCDAADLATRLENLRLLQGAARENQPVICVVL